MAEIWPELTKNEQAYYLNEQAGANQTQNLAAILSNFNNAIAATNTALASNGSAWQENEKYMNSLQAKWTAVQASFQQLAARVIDSDLVKAILDIANAFLKLLDTPLGGFITQVTLLTTALFGLVKVIQSMHIINGIVSSFKAFTTATTAATTATTAATTATTAATAATTGFGIALKGAFPIIGLISTALVGLISLVGFLKEDSETTAEKIDRLNSSISGLESEISSLQSEYDNLASKDTVTKIEEQRLQILEQQIKAKERLLELDKQERLEAVYQQLFNEPYEIPQDIAENGLFTPEFSQFDLQFGSTQVSVLENMIDAYNQIYSKIESVKNGLVTLNGEYDSVIEKNAAVAKYSYDVTLQKLLDEGHSLAEAQQMVWEEMKNTSEESIEDYLSSSLDQLEDSSSELEQIVLEFGEPFLDLFEQMGEDAPPELQAVIDSLQAFYDKIEDVSGASEDLQNVGENLNGIFGDFTSAAQQMEQDLANLESIQEAVNSGMSLNAEQLAILMDLTSRYPDLIAWENGQLIINEQVLYNAANALKAETIEKLNGEVASINLTSAENDLAGATANAGNKASGAAGNFSKLVPMLNNTTTAASKAAIALGALSGMTVGTKKVSVSSWSDVEDYVSANGVPTSGVFSTMFVPEVKADLSSAQNIASQLQGLINSVGSWNLGGGGYSSGGGGGGGSGGGGGGGSSTPQKTAEEILEEKIKEQNDLLEEQISLLDDRAWFLEQELPDDPTASQQDFEKYKEIQKQRVEIFRQAQAELHKTAEKFREMGLSENDEAIRELQKDWWNYQNDIEEIYDSIDETVEEITENIKENWEEALDSQIEKLEELADKYETAFSYVADKAAEEVEALEEQRDAIEESYDKQISALEEQNDKLQEQIELEQALDALARARQSKVLVYKDGRFQYVQDIDQVSEAQSQLDEIKRQQQLDEQIKNLEEARDAELAIIDERIEYWEKMQEEWSSVVDNYTKEQDRLLAEQILGTSLEGENWEKRLDNLQTYANQYIAIMNSLKGSENASDIVGEGGTWSTSKDSATIAAGAGMTAADQIALQQAQQDYREAFAEGNHDAMKAAHDAAEAIRNKYGYSGGAEGTDYIKLNNDVIYGSGEEIPWLNSYASGTTGAYGGMSLVGENGPELRILNKNDGIIPSDVTRNLWKWGSFSPGDLFNNLSNQIMNVTVENLNLPNVQNGEDFVDYMRNNFWRKTLQFNMA